MIEVSIYGSSLPESKKEVYIEIQTDDEVKLSDFCKGIFRKIINQWISFSYREKNNGCGAIATFNMDISANEHNISNIETICSRFKNLGWNVTVC